MMTSSNGNIFRVTDPLCREFTGPGEFPTQGPVTRSFDVSFDLRMNKRLSKQPWGWWLETLSWSLWRHCNDYFGPATACMRAVRVTAMRFRIIVTSRKRHCVSFQRQLNRLFNSLLRLVTQKHKTIRITIPLCRGIYRWPVVPPQKSTSNHGIHVCFHEMVSPWLQ